MKRKSNNQKKQTLAIVLASILLISGTFAWQSFSQSVINETAGFDADQGSRLHNDFNGTNADVYVENFASEEGSTLYTRIRLQEYMEIGTNAGTGAATIVRGDKPVSSTLEPEFANKDSWDIYLHQGNTRDEDDIRTYLGLNYGDIMNTNQGTTVYMPTFNKNFDDKSAEINGSLAGLDGSAQYDDYTTYSLGESILKNAVYSKDAVVAQGQTPNADGVVEIQETHVAQSTLSGYVTTMEDWTTGDQEPGNFWVYDVDGWAYWANGLAPQTATSLLVDSISKVKTPDADYYYALHVVNQTATAGEWGIEDSTDLTEQGIYADVTVEGLHLLNTIAEINPLDAISLMSWDMDTEISTYVQNVITLDGISFYIIDSATITSVDEDGYSLGRVNATLLLATDSIGGYPYDQNGSVKWSTSEMRNEVLKDWLDTYPTLAAYAVRVPVVTDGYYVDADTYISTDEIDEVTYDKVFLMSQMEFVNTYRLNGDAASMIYYGSDYWLRSPKSASTVSVVDPTTGMIRESGNATTATAGVRPALWVTH